jgi:hypothetical protein
MYIVPRRYLGVKRWYPESPLSPTAAAEEKSGFVIPETQPQLYLAGAILNRAVATPKSLLVIGLSGGVR